MKQIDRLRSMNVEEEMPCNDCHMLGDCHCQSGCPMYQEWLESEVEE